MKGLRFATKIVLLSGAVASGKSSVARALIHKYDFQKISTSNYLTKLVASEGLVCHRLSLQNLGDSLDKNTDYFWPVDVALEQMSSSPTGKGHWLLDSVRKERQVAHFRTAFKNVLHIHLKASEHELRRRYNARITEGVGPDSLGNYESLIAHPNEIASRCLENIADRVFDTGELSSETIAQSILLAIEGSRNGAGSPH